jgi:hypothetical protein
MSTFESLAFFRGVSARYPTDRPFIQIPRKDRLPKNSPVLFHEIANAWFKSRFGIQYRSRAIFLTSRIISATAHAQNQATVVRVIPLTLYTFCWSPTVSDLLFAARSLTSRPEIEAFLERALYSEANLSEAHASGHEVMLACDSYVAIPTNLISPKPHANGTRLILPG